MLCWAFHSFLFFFFLLSIHSCGKAETLCFEAGLWEFVFVKHKGISNSRQCHLAKAFWNTVRIPVHPKCIEFFLLRPCLTTSSWSSLTFLDPLVPVQHANIPDKMTCLHAFCRWVTYGCDSRVHKLLAVQNHCFGVSKFSRLQKIQAYVMSFRFFSVSGFVSLFNCLYLILCKVFIYSVDSCILHKISDQCGKLSLRVVKCLITALFHV